MASDNSILTFRSSLSKFSYSAGESGSSSRKPLKPSHKSPPKASTPSSASNSPKKRKKRGYAQPETYSDLSQVNDYLKPGLDVVFCGINPGRKSAQTGNHYANPSNHFWWCLHSAGFTDKQISPKEDWSMPERFNFGLTNLVDRPTAEQMELSNQEQLDSVPIFLGKIARFRPRLVVFVGISIAKVVETKLGVTHTGPNTWGLRPFKMVYPDPQSGFEETLFFASPSTSGLVTAFQRPEKARIFGEARRLVDDLKAGAGTVATDHLYVVRAHQIAQPPVLDLDSPSLRRFSTEPEVKEEAVPQSTLQVQSY
uniref:Uracil-DNA glycosylase-like domain-containing protein n=1 Tax=Mycena chlorophos TaxID=658473 RepID=A0ABQ0LRV0_MYCCL|nr:predicted protein [Mycena chlorophos]